MAQGTVKSLVSSLNSNLNKYVDYGEVTKTDCPTINANSSGSITFSLSEISKDGYICVGVLAITGSGTTGLVLQEYYMTATTTVTVYFRNVTSSAIKPNNIRLRLLYAKQ